MKQETLWVEKYRPQTIDECNLPQHLEKTFSEMVAAGDIQNMLFCGTAGCGKTTVAKALCNELNLDYIFINASEEGNIDTLRGKIRQFATTISLSGNKKVVILDEADYLNAQSTQPALRGFIEDFSDNCRFILTCNKKNRIIEPLHSRCGVYEFNTTKKETNVIGGEFFKRLSKILKQEQIEFDAKELAELVMKFMPDWRRCINECQRRSTSGKLEVGSNLSSLSASMDELFDILKNKDFKKMRRWVVDNIDVDASAIFRGIYDGMNESVDPSSIPHLVLILAEYQYKQAFVADSELNVVACLTEIMGDVKFV